MSRSAVLLVLAALLAAPAVSEEPRQGVPIPDEKKLAAELAWNTRSEQHGAFFRYHVFAQSKGLAAETQPAWEKRPLTEKKEIVDRDEAFLTSKLGEILSRHYGLGLGEQELVKAVWPELLPGLAKLQHARQNGDNPTHVKAAQDELKKLAGKLGGLSVDFNQIFDGGKIGLRGSADPDPVSTVPNYLKPDKSKADKQHITARVKAPEVLKVLASAESFDKFLREKPNVAKEAVPGLNALYQLVNSPDTPAEVKNEVSHILPSVVVFLQEGKPILMDTSRDSDRKPGAAWVHPNKYGEPESMTLTPRVASLPPLLAGNVLGHEIQHIYDAYAGRPDTLDNEMRAFKVNIMLTRATRAAAPDEYDAMKKSRESDVRRWIDSFNNIDGDFSADLADKANPGRFDRFHNRIAFGHHYCAWHGGQGVMASDAARFPLSRALDPDFGPERQIAFRKTQLVELEAAVRAHRAALAVAQSRWDRLEAIRVAEMLEDAEKSAAGLRETIEVSERQMDLMKAEYSDQVRKYGGKPPSHSLDLKVDESYNPSGPRVVGK